MEFNMLQPFTILNRFNNNDVTYSIIQLTENVCHLQLATQLNISYWFHFRNREADSQRDQVIFLSLKKKKKKLFYFVLEYTELTALWQF